MKRKSGQIEALAASKKLCSAAIEGSDALPTGLVLHTYARLVPGALALRYKRFLGDVLFDGPSGGTTVVHVPNTGPMTGLLDFLPAQALLTKSDSATRKHAHTLEWLRPAPDAAWVGVHSAKANAMVRVLLESGALAAQLPHVSLRSEVKYGKEKSRVDFVLDRAEAASCYLEVKSVTLAETSAQGTRMALFPDTVSLRAQRHVRELTAMAKAGSERAALLFLVQRGDCSCFAPCHEKDPEYGRLLVEAASAGVHIVAVACELDAAAAKVVCRGVLDVDLKYKMPV